MRCATLVALCFASSSGLVMTTPQPALRPKPTASPRSSATIAVERLKAMKSTGGLPNAVAAERLRSSSGRRSSTPLMTADTPSDEPDVAAAADETELATPEEPEPPDLGSFGIIDKATNIGTALFGVYVLLNILGLNPFMPYSSPTP